METLTPRQLGRTYPLFPYDLYWQLKYGKIRDWAAWVGNPETWLDVPWDDPRMLRRLVRRVGRECRQLARERFLPRRSRGVVVSPVTVTDEA